MLQATPRTGFRSGLARPPPPCSSCRTPSPEWTSGAQILAICGLLAWLWAALAPWRDDTDLAIALPGVLGPLGMLMSEFSGFRNFARQLAGL